MALDTSEVRVFGDGNVYVAPTGTTFPTTTAGAWTGFTDLGYLTDDGPSVTPGMDTTDISAWQSFYALKTIVTGRSFEIALPLMQWNADTMKLAFGGGTISASGSDWLYTPPTPSTLDERAMGIEVRENTVITRFFFPRVIVTNLSEVTFRRSEAARFDLTVRVLADDTGDAWSALSSDAAWNPA